MFSMSELAIILVVALVVFGPGKLPEIGKAVGKSIGEFKNALSQDKEPPQISAGSTEKKA